MTPISDNSFEDPLAVVVDAFVDQSVPEGPDEATKRRLIAKLIDADQTPKLYVASLAPSAPRVRTRPRWGLGLAAAATVAAAAAGVYTLVGPREQRPAPGARQQAAVEPRTEAEDAQFEALVKQLEQHIRLDRRQILSRREVWKMASAFIQANPKLARSESWRVAQEKLSDALERPEFIGLGVGVISTLPWTHARF